MTEYKISDDQVNQIAEAIAKKMPEQHHGCLVFSEQEINTMHEFFGALAKTKSVALATFVGFLVLGFFGVVVMGIVSWLKRELGIGG
jgi:hypothetical protein